MAEQKFLISGGFFDSINGDRLYSANEMNRPYRRLIGEGIFATPQGTPSTDLQVLSANDGMNIIVKAGEGLLGGKWFENPSDIAITVPDNTNIVPRMDSVIIQVDNRESVRIPNIIYRTGTASSNPLPPALSPDENIVEKRVANIYVAAGAMKIGQDVISDLRGSEECLWITSLVKQVDTSALFAQWQAAYQAYYEQIIEELQNIRDGSAYLLKNGGIKQTLESCDNETDKVPSAKLFHDVANQKIDNSNLKIYTGELIVQSSSNSSTTISLPDGWTAENCIVLSTGIDIDSGGDYRKYYYDDSINTTTENYPHRHVTILQTVREGEAIVNLSIDNKTLSSIKYCYKIAILKVSD